LGLQKSLFRIPFKPILEAKKAYIGSQKSLFWNSKWALFTSFVNLGGGCYGKYEYLWELQEHINQKPTTQ